MVYLDNIDGYEEVYEEFDGLSGTTEFIYYDIGQYQFTECHTRFSFRIIKM